MTALLPIRAGSRAGKPAMLLAALGLLVLAVLLLLPLPARAAGAEGYKMKINAIDAKRAPELAIFFTLLDPKGLPIPSKKLQSAQVRMNGKIIEKDAEVESLKASDHAVAVAMVACGYQGCAGPMAKAQAKGFEELAKGFRDQDKGTAFAYVNNFDNLTKGAFVTGAEAAAAIGAVKPSDDAYQAKLLDTLRQAVQIFRTNDKNLPENRFIVVFSDGADSMSLSEDDALGKVYTIVSEAKKARVRIMALGYSDAGDTFLEKLEILARKSGGTYRKAARLKDVPLLFKYFVAEIWGQLVVEVAPDMKAKRDYTFAVSARYRGQVMSSSQQVAFPLKVDELHFRWRYWGTRVAIAVAVLLLAFAIFLVVRKILKKLKKKKELAALKAKAGDAVKPPPEAAAGKKAAEGGAKAAAGGKKAAEDGAKAAAGGKKAAEGGAKAAAGGKKAASGGEKAAAGGNGKQEGEAKGKVCPDCGRTMLPGWSKCMFCAAGIGKAKAQ